MKASTYEFDVVVIGAGHAGTEAALAAARLGAKTALLTTNCDTVGQMSCNPAIGGVAKGQIVREIDALGGVMGQVIDATGIQFRLLNRRKGPAMHSPRAQADKKAYQFEVKRLVEEQPNLTLRQEVVEDLLVGDEGGVASDQAPFKPHITGVRVRGDALYRARAVILTTGTFLQAIMHTGEAKNGRRSGRGGDHGGYQPCPRPVGLSSCTVQDRDPRAVEWPDDRLLRNRDTTGRRSAAAVFLPKLDHLRPASPLLDYLHK